MTRIVVDPESLRLMASRMRGAATLLSSSGRQLASRPLPAMPAGLASIVSETVTRATADLHDLAAGLVRDSGMLYVRATWAEAELTSASPWTPLGGDGWADAAAPDDLAESQTAASEAGIETAEAWSLEVVDNSSDAATTSGDSAASDDVSELRSLVAADLAAHPQGPLGGLPLSVSDLRGAGIDVFGDVVDAGGGRVSAAAGLGNALEQMTESATGLGVLGCLTVGADGTLDERLGDAG